jgi:hypothetical protein
MRAAIDRGWLLGALVLALYIYLAPTTIVGGDNSEFVALTALGGRAHPSGYPLYLLWLHATAWLPGVSLAHTTAIATCILGAAAVVVLHAACRAWGARPLAATLACAMYAASPVVMLIHSEAEVFALNALIVAGIVLVAAEHGPLRGAWRAAMLGLLAGLGMSNHLTCVLVAPLGVYGAWRGVRESGRHAAVVIAAALGAVALGLTPYLQTALAPDTAISWGSGHSLHATLALFLRSDYGAASLSARGGDAKPVASLLALAHTVGRAWWWAPLGLGLVTLGARAIRGAPGRARAPWIAYAAAWLLAGPLFAARFNIDPAGFGIHLVQRMHLLPVLLTAVPVAVGFDWVGRARLATASAAWGLVAFPLLAAPSLAQATAEHTPAVELSLVNTLNALPPNAALIIDGDDFAFGIPYVQEVLGIRRDVIAVNWPTLKFPWALARLHARGVAFDPYAPAASGDRPSVRLADELNAAGHPVFVDDFESSILAARPVYPFAGLLRVLNKDEALPKLDDIAAMNARAFSHFDLDYPLPGPDDGFMTVAHLRYSETWFHIAASYRAAGYPEIAQEMRERGLALSPRD